MSEIEVIGEDMNEEFFRDFTLCQRCDKTCYLGNKYCEDCANKLADIAEVYKQENSQLQMELEKIEKALELACEEITGSCEYCPYATMPECPIEADCVEEKIKYFKQQAEQEVENE